MTDEEYLAQGGKTLEASIKAVESLVETFPEPRRAAMKRMLDGKVGEQFMIAPASTRRSFHNAFPGGLALHSLGVVRYAVKLAETLSPGRWAKDRIVFCALFHDLGKAGLAGHPHYVRTTDIWRERRGEFFEVCRDQPMPNSEKSLLILAEAGIPIDYEEALAIRLNDGPGAKENEPYAFREPDLALIIHWADAWQTRQEKRKDGTLIGNL